MGPYGYHYIPAYVYKHMSISIGLQVLYYKHILTSVSLQQSIMSNSSIVM